MASGLSKIIAATLMSASLSACSTFEPEKVACPSVSVAKGAERAYIEGITAGQIGYVRFNGAWAQCSPTQNGYDMELQLGLMMKRDFTEGYFLEEMPIDITFAYLDDDDNVVSRYVHSDTVFFSDYKDKSKPVLIINKEVPAGTRVVMALGKAVE